MKKYRLEQFKNKHYAHWIEYRLTRINLKLYNNVDFLIIYLEHVYKKTVESF